MPINATCQQCGATLPVPDEYAGKSVRCGGCLNHRMNLSDRVVVKDNHGRSAGSGFPAYDSVRAAYPDLQITHRYLETGGVAPSLDTTYTATWRLQGTQQWRPVSGTVTIPDEPVPLTVLEATPTLVG